MSLTLHVDPSDTGQLFTTYQASGVHTGTPSDGSAVQVEDDEGDGIADVMLRATGAQAPLWRATTPLLLAPCLDFDGTAHTLSLYNQIGTTPKAVSTVIAAGAFTLILAFHAESITSTATAYNAHVLIGDTGGYWGVFLRNVSGQRKVVLYNYDGSEDIFEINISEATNYVLMFRHESNNLYASLNGAAESSPTASGNTANLASGMQLAGGGLGSFYNGRIGELKLWNTGNADGAGNVATQIAAMMAKWVTAAPSAAVIAQDRSIRRRLHPRVFSRVN